MTARRWIAMLLGLALLTGACASDPDTEPAPDQTVGVDELAITVASYDLAVGDQQRFIAGVLTPQRELIGFGQVQMRFTHLGADPSGPATPGPAATASWLPVPGIEPTGTSDQPTLIDQPGVAGVYQTRVDLGQAGFWTVEVTAQVDGTERTGTATFSVADRHQVPAVGDPAPTSRNLTVESDADPAAIDSRAATAGAAPTPACTPPPSPTPPSTPAGTTCSTAPSSNSSCRTSPREHPPAKPHPPANRLAHPRLRDPAHRPCRPASRPGVDRRGRAGRATLLGTLGMPPVDLHLPTHRLGIMGPLCGMTRSVARAATGEIVGAWRYNPGGLASVTGAWACVARTRSAVAPADG
ncbi:MAG TPA: DUF2752 domain-containing protein [Nitriliruptorales bacterium]